jgi:hypothetical protein
VNAPLAGKLSTIFAVPTRDRRMSAIPLFETVSRATPRDRRYRRESTQGGRSYRRQISATLAESGPTFLCNQAYIRANFAHRLLAQSDYGGEWAAISFARSTWRWEPVF